VINTLFGRLFIASVLVLSLFLGLIAYTINQLTVENTYQTQYEKLRLQNHLLLSSARINNDQIELPEDLREARFDEYESGLYGFVSDVEGNILWQSYSAHSLTFEKGIFQTTLNKLGTSQYEIVPGYFAYHHMVLWEVIDEKPQLLTFTVLEESQPILDNIDQLQQTLRFWLFAIGLLLITLLMLILRWGTKPLRQLASNLKLIEDGVKNRIEGNFPVEFYNVTNNLNQLIDSERRQRERYHSTLADLAHSLKTPLAVIHTELDSTANSLITEQVQRMDEIIKHQLQRAVVASPHQLTEAISVEQCVGRLISAMEKVYAGKHLRFDVRIVENTVFKGDQRDLMEVLGNLIDNACKASKSKVDVVANNMTPGLNIEIHDDGNGIPLSSRENLIKRGHRADTRYTGQGIGLDVANDIIESYNGKLEIAQSSLGGALISIRLPQVNQTHGQ
jgi:two-component system sensor histidine kinase PhoQ